MQTPRTGSIVTLIGMVGTYRVEPTTRIGYDFQAIPTDVKHVYGIAVDSSFPTLYSSVTSVV